MSSHKMNLVINKSGNQELLIARCKKQHRQAQHQVYEWLAPKMLAVCRRYVNDNNEAESVMIAGFMKVFNKIGQFTGEGSFEGWVRRIMVNESLLYIRKNKNMYLEVDIEHADSEPDYTEAAENLDAEVLLTLIDKLPVGYKTVFNMYAIEGYSHKEIAVALNISEGTSKSQLSRARAILQKEILAQEKLWNGKQRGHGKA